MALGDMGKCAVASLYLRPRHEADANCDALALTAADAAHAPAGALIANHRVPAVLQALQESQAQAQLNILTMFLSVNFEVSTVELQTPVGALFGYHRVRAGLRALQAHENRPMTHQNQPMSTQRSSAFPDSAEGSARMCCRVMTWVL